MTIKSPKPDQDNPGVSDNDHSNERGAILITTLLIITIMSALAVALVDDIRFGVKRAIAARDADQARWHALSAEALAVKILRESRKNNRTKTSLSQSWALTRPPFPVPGGSIKTHLSDAGNCFNVNSLVREDTRYRWNKNEDEQNRLISLLSNIGYTDQVAEQLTHLLTDWVDTDARASTYGAEDLEYLLAKPAYRTPNNLITDITSIRAIKGMTTDQYNALSPYLCALPKNTLFRVNINTLTEPYGSLLLQTALGDEVTLEMASRIIRERPRTGYNSLNQIWQHTALDGVDTDKLDKNRLTLKSYYFSLEANVIQQQISFKLNSLFAVGDDDRVTHVTRKFGDDF